MSYQRVKQWREENPEKYREQRQRTNRRYREKHQESLRVRRQENYRQNREQELTVNRQWCQDHPEKMRQYRRETARRRALGRNPLSIAYAEILRRDPCVYCGSKPVQVDHIVPVSRDGTSDWDNLTAACGSCNASKHAAPMLVWLGKRY